MSEANYKPNGEVQGDNTRMKDAGYTTGVTDSYGADLSGDATNSEGRIGSASRSDAWDKSAPCDPKGRM